MRTNKAAWKYGELRRFRRALALAALLWIAGFAAHAGDELPWFKASFLDLRDDISEASANDKRLILYFSMVGCPYCKKLLEVNFADPDIVATTRKHFDLVALDIHGAREVIWTDGKPRPEKEFAAFMNVRGTPTLIFFDEDGEIALRIDGYYEPRKFRAALDYVAQRQEKRTSLDSYSKRAVSGKSAGKVNA